MALPPTRLYRVPGEEGGGGEERLRYHVLAAHAMVRGEHQPAECAARLDLGECAKILAASQIPLSALAARDPASRVGGDENRGFEEVIRAWTLRILSGVEGD
jgi:hypothetical protein